MAANRGTILVVLEEGTTFQRVFGRRLLPARPFVTTHWSRLARADLRERSFDAILYQADGTRAVGRARLGRLRRLAGSVPLLPFRARGPAGPGGRGRRRGEVSGLGAVLTVPLDAQAVEMFLLRERRTREAARLARRAFRQVRDREKKLRALAAIVRTTGHELDPDRIVELAMDQVRRFLRIRVWRFFLLDPDEGVLRVEKTGGEEVALRRGSPIGVGEGNAGRAAQTRQPVLSEDARRVGAGDLSARGRRDRTTRTSLAVPLMSRGRVIGVVEAIDIRTSGPLRPEHTRLLSVLLEPAAVAVDNALLLRKSEALSITDDLTKLHNSHYLNATLRREVERGRRYRTPVSLIFLDLDGFKDVNDRYGHLCGSRTLVEVGGVIKGTVREIDVVSRYGGDEFTVILPQTGPEGAQTIAERIRQRIAETDFLTSYGLKVRITASVGIASFPDHGRTKDDLIARADQAMYVVKGCGKNGVAVAGPIGARAAAASAAS